ncbi:hypothetical protein SAMN04487896_4718 [Paenibacillus sp. ov031]|uniref:hypothetical protein n=1 Tax=Paenibacillus TaxID=44249 RepID=UPI00091EBA7A|nr:MULTISPECIES: hypothetical protein [Paenibacillus]MCZ1263273.1 hypothetical protein [Paenibacillus tundrae]SHN81143.1 hypothetical protein SAMN04487896_4718 [Paenibacillus sp. ov031]
MIQQRKPLGIGTLSLLVLAMGLAFNFPWGTEKVQISHYLFNLLNVPIYSNGDQGLHLPFVAAAIFWIPAVIIASKYRSHYGTKVAFNVAAFMLLLCIVGPVVNIVDRFVNS